MKYILKIVLYSLLANVLGGCSDLPSISDDQEGIVSQPNILRNFDPRLISTLKNEQKRSVKLNDLIKNMENSKFYINDHIVFSNKKESEKENENITLHIQTQCIESETHKTFTKNTTMDYTNEIMLISLIPEQLFSYGNSWWLNEKNHHPTCSFHFEAKNEAGGIHYFELPHLPILSFENSLNLSLIEQHPHSREIERVAHFPILKTGQIENYAVISGKNTKINKLQLICESFHLSFDVDDLRHYDLWKLQGWSFIKDEDKINQPCRFVSFNDDFIVGVSQLFPIVFPTQGVTIQLITDTQEIDTLKDNYPLSVSGYDFNGIQQMKSDFKKENKLGAYHNLAVLKIENTTIDTMRLYIPEASFYTDIHFFYSEFIHRVITMERMSLIKNIGAFITMEDSAQFILTPSLIKSKEQSMEINEEGYHLVYNDNHVLLTLTAGAAALIPLSVNIQQQCDFRKDWLGEKRVLKKIHNTGMIFEGNMLPIYRVLDTTDMDSAQKTIIGLIEPYQNPSNAFRLDVGMDIEENIDKYFYKNTCSAFKALRFDTATTVHQGAWKVQTTENGKVQFTEDPEHSLSQAESIFVQNKIREHLAEQEQEKRREQRQSRVQSNIQNTSSRREIRIGDGPPH